MFRGAVSEMTAPVKTSSLSLRQTLLFYLRAATETLLVRAYISAHQRKKLIGTELPNQEASRIHCTSGAKLNWRRRVRRTMQIAPCPKTLFVLAKKIHLSSVERGLERVSPIVGRSPQPIALYFSLLHTLMLTLHLNVHARSFATCDLRANGRISAKWTRCLLTLLIATLRWTEIYATVAQGERVWESERVNLCPTCLKGYKH